MSRHDLLVVIPAFNEEPSIASVVRAVRNHGFDVLVVDDGSNDETARVSEQSGARVVRLPFNLGVGGALRTGFRIAVEEGYLSVVQIDADGQHPVNQIHELIHSAAEHDAHIVIGSRYFTGEPSFRLPGARRVAMRFLSWLVSHAGGQRITDATSGFRLIREPLLSEFAREFPAYYLGDTFEATIAAVRAGYRVTEIPANLQPRDFGTSSTTSFRAILLIAKVIMITVFRLHVGLRKHVPVRKD
jgi:glycosyltransferase involved in cell wall biosynthesis